MGRRELAERRARGDCKGTDDKGMEVSAAAACLPALVKT